MRGRITKRSIILGVVAFVALCVGVACSNKEKEEQPEVTVQVAPAEKGTVEEVVTAEAILYPIDQAALTPKVSAPVKAFYVNRGSKVHRGQTVAVLENRDLAAAVVDNKGAYEQAQAAYGIATSSSLPEEWQKAEYDLKAAKADYEAQQKIYDSRKVLYDQGALPRKEYDQAAVAVIQAKAAYEIAEKHLAALESSGKKDQVKAAKGQLTSAEGKLEGASAQLSYTTITSPINGVVTDRPLYPGETAAAGTPIMTIMDTSTVIAKAHIPQSDAAALKPGDLATITFGDYTANGKVTLVSPALDPNSTTVEVWVTAPNPDNNLRPGSTVNVQMTARSVDNAVTVPAVALLKTPEGATTVMIVGDDGKAHQVSVETGIRQGDRVQITKGLSGNEKVITSGAYGLPNDTKVKIAEAQPPEKPGADEKSGGQGKPNSKAKE
jgi:multidrug efflux pump subunit AcrA (membrane-fusion protein)